MPSNRRPPGEQPATPTSTNRVAPGPLSTACVRAAGKDVTVAGPMSIGRLACSTAAPRARRDCRSYRRHWAQRHLGTPGHCNHGVDPPVARDARVGGWRRHDSVLLRVPSLNLIASALAERLTRHLGQAKASVLNPDPFWQSHPAGDVVAVHGRLLRTRQKVNSILRSANFLRTTLAAIWPSRACATRYVALAASCQEVFGA